MDNRQDGHNRTERLNLRFTPEQKVQIQNNADGAHMSMNEYCVHCLLGRPFYTRQDWTNFAEFKAAMAVIGKLAGSLRQLVALAKVSITPGVKRDIEQMILDLRRDRGQMIDAFLDLAEAARRSRRNDHKKVGRAIFKI